MPEVKFEHLSQHEIDNAWKLYKNSPLRCIFLHLFNKRIDEQRKLYDKIEPEDFKPHRQGIVKMQELADILKTDKTPKSNE